MNATTGQPGLWALLVPMVSLVQAGAAWFMLAQPRRFTQYLALLLAGLAAWSATDHVWTVPWLVAGLVVVALAVKPRPNLLVMRACVAIMIGLIVGVALCANAGWAGEPPVTSERQFCEQLNDALRVRPSSEFSPTC